jgi:hypothetical protein
VFLLAVTLSIPQTEDSTSAILNGRSAMLAHADGDVNPRSSEKPGKNLARHALSGDLHLGPRSSGRRLLADLHEVATMLPARSPAAGQPLGRSWTCAGALVQATAALSSHRRDAARQTAARARSSPTARCRGRIAGAIAVPQLAFRNLTFVSFASHGARGSFISLVLHVTRQYEPIAIKEPLHLAPVLELQD